MPYLESVLPFDNFVVVLKKFMCNFTCIWEKENSLELK